MRLSQVMAGTGAVRSGQGDLDPDVRSVAYDSRRVSAGDVFFALSGAKADGAQFARQAIGQGAVAIVSERALSPSEAGLAVTFSAASARRALALAAANLHLRPGRALTLLGVTGTNGKTTTSYLAEAMLAAAGERPGVIGTVSHRFAGTEIPAAHTTPESADLQALLADMVRAGTTAVVMEVSSHALAQERVHGLCYSSAAFTNLTRDHLDFHGTMEAYFAAKRSLFTSFNAGPATLNADDPFGARLLAELTRDGRTAFGYSARGNPAALWAKEAAFSIDGCQGVLVTPQGETPFASHLVGLHNLENILAAAGLVLGAGIPLGAVAKGLAALTRVPGRLERISGRGRHVFVDYAHTDDALERALAALRPFVRGRLLCVFGCGGDRDRGKRPLMAEAAGRGCDLCIVTSDNPRTEDPLAIIDEMVAGFDRLGVSRLSEGAARDGNRGYLVEPDRRAAIGLAVSLVREEDVILLAGKGHEGYQIVGAEKRPFDDRDEARRALGAG
jgi:UDP-N-acetylmuramoyl-L-alanyl-D-glutamate--2,6-diaminopimelate ligase